MEVTTKMRFALLIILAAACCAPASAADIVTGTDEIVSALAGFYASDADANQDWVREYDGRKFRLAGIELLHLLGYKGPLQYRFEARDILLGDEEVDLGIFSGSTFGLTFNTTRMLHRLAKIPSVNPNPLLGGFSPTGAPLGDAFIDIDPEQRLFVDRIVTSLGTNFMCGANRDQRLAIRYWQESEDGYRQVLFRANENYTPPGETTTLIGNRQRGSVAVPIDRDTKETSLGADLKLGSETVLNYRFVATDFNERGGRATDDRRNFSPVNTLTRITTDTTGHVLKLRSRLSDRLYVTGAHTSRERENTRATRSDRTSVDVRSTNLAMVYRATDSLTLSARYRDFELDSDVSPVFVGSVIANQALSKDLTAWELDAAYSGIRRAYVRLGYERREVDRSINPVHEPEEEFERPLTSVSTDSNILKARLRYYPTTRFSVSGSFEDWDSDNSGYVGVGNRLKKTNLNATYLLTDTFALYGDYNKWDERNNSPLIPLASIPTPAVSTADTEIRQMAAGQGYTNENTTTSIGAWLVVSSRLSLDVNLAEVKTNASALWVLGLDPAFTPHLEPSSAPYRADNTQWSMGATYAIDRATRIYGRFINSRSDGRTLLDTSVYPAGAGPSWTPVAVKENRWTIGLARDLSARDRLQFDFSRADWQDRIDPGSDGKFILTRLAWARTF